jgi:hypothetical protein
MIMGCSPRYLRVTTRDHGRAASAEGIQPHRGQAKPDIHDLIAEGSYSPSTTHNHDFGLPGIPLAGMERGERERWPRNPHNCETPDDGNPEQSEYPSGRMSGLRLRARSRKPFQTTTYR